MKVASFKTWRFFSWFSCIYIAEIASILAIKSCKNSVFPKILIHVLMNQYQTYLLTSIFATFPSICLWHHDNCNNVCLQSQYLRTSMSLSVILKILIATKFCSKHCFTNFHFNVSRPFSLFTSADPRYSVSRYLLLSKTCIILRDS